MPRCDLPKHLRHRNHEDWIWPLSKIPRGWNVWGHRCSGWRKFPILLFGYNTTRWMTPGDKDVVEVPEFAGVNGYKKGKKYGPSPLQKYSKWGFSLVWPLHFEFHYIFKSGKPLSFRIGLRWDSYDNYYNLGVYIGGAWN